MRETWQLSGLFLQSCHCDPGRPCSLLGIEPYCAVLLGWHISFGSYGSLSLSGLNVALAIRCTGDPPQAWLDGALYLDARATPEQRVALQIIFSGGNGGHPAQLNSRLRALLGVRAVPIVFEHNPDRCTLTVGDLAEIELEADADLPPSSCVAPGFPATQAHPRKLRWQDYGCRWSLPGRHAVFSPFAYES